MLQRYGTANTWIITRETHQSQTANHDTLANFGTLACLRIDLLAALLGAKLSLLASSGWCCEKRRLLAYAPGTKGYTAWSVWNLRYGGMRQAHDKDFDLRYRRGVQEHLWIYIVEQPSYQSSDHHSTPLSLCLGGKRLRENLVLFSSAMKAYLCPRWGGRRRWPVDPDLLCASLLFVRGQ